MSRKRGKNKPSKSKAKAASDVAVPEEVLAEGSGPNEQIDADVQALADAASDALPPPADVEIKAKKTRLTTDAWGQPIEVDEVEEPDAVEAAEENDEPGAQLAADIEEDAVAETQAEAEQFEEAVLSAEAAEVAEAVEAVEAASNDETLESASDEEGVETAPTDGDEILEAADGSERADAAMGADATEGADDEDELGASLPTTAATMDEAQLKNLVEALVFAADKPVTLQRLRQLSRVSDVQRLEKALEQLAVDYAPRGVALQQVSGGYQFRTNTQYSVWVQQLIAGRPVRLSRAQLETLAIVAYRQPITRPEVDDIRGVDSSATLRLLLDRSLIRVLGKKEDVGRPTLYGTTKEFLDFFSLSDLRELPTLREYSELTAESRKVMSDRLGIDADAIPTSTDGDDFEVADEAAPVDQVAEDAAAIAAVAAVTDVYGIEEQDSTASVSEGGAATSTEEVEASSSDEAAEQVEASSSDEAAEQVEASSSDEVAEQVEASSSDEVAEPVEASSNGELAEMSSSAQADSVEASSSDERVEQVEASSNGELAEMSSSDQAEQVEASSSDEAAEQVEGSSNSELVEMSSSEQADSVEASSSDEVAEPVETSSNDEAADQVEASSTNELAEQLETSSNDEPAEPVEASSSDEAAEELEASSDDDAGELAASSDAHASEDPADVGMPRGAAQRDIIGRSTDLDEDPVLRAEAEAELDAAAVRAHDHAHNHGAAADDVAEEGSEALAGDESSTDDLDAAGEDGSDESGV